MKIIVTGDREWTSHEIIEEALLSHTPCTIIVGGARGADKIAEELCERHGIDCEVYPANWEEYGRAAGPIRNQEMLDKELPELVLAFHNEIFKSKGTKDMCRRALRKGIPVRLYTGKMRQGYYITLNDLEYDKSDPNLF